MSPQPPEELGARRLFVLQLQGGWARCEVAAVVSGFRMRRAACCSCGAAGRDVRRQPRTGAREDESCCSRSEAGERCEAAAAGKATLGSKAAERVMPATGPGTSSYEPVLTQWERVRNGRRPRLAGGV